MSYSYFSVSDMFKTIESQLINDPILEQIDNPKYLFQEKVNEITKELLILLEADAKRFKGDKFKTFLFSEAECFKYPENEFKTHKDHENILNYFHPAILTHLIYQSEDLYKELSESYGKYLKIKDYIKSYLNGGYKIYQKDSEGNIEEYKITESDYYLNVDNGSIVLPTAQEIEILVSKQQFTEFMKKERAKHLSKTRETPFSRAKLAIEVFIENGFKEYGDLRGINKHTEIVTKLKAAKLNYYHCNKIDSLKRMPKRSFHDIVNKKLRSMGKESLIYGDSKFESKY